ncbi:MAG: hypothetical protein K2X86_11395 [Cytophagaceae bacterium]|nr:hypothetical protein [Cytophagaceae bacterium]
MRKLFALLFVAAAFTFVACEKKGETTNADSAKVDSMPAADPTPVAPADSAKSDSVAADTTKK